MAALPGITGEPKVTDFERHISVEEHVSQLEVPVENPLQVNVPRKQVPTQFRGKKSVFVESDPELLEPYSVADPDPGSGAFLTPGSSIHYRFFPDPGSRIPDPKPTFLRA